MNAFVHRDYWSFASIIVGIYHDRVEIECPGGLPAGMKPELLGKRSIPRNSLLFGIFHRMGAEENIGSGIRKIRELSKENKVFAPEFDIHESWFNIIFPRTGLSKTDHRKQQKELNSQTGIKSEQSLSSRQVTGQVEH